jgi:transcriptional antiterminator RfaH
MLLRSVAGATCASAASWSGDSVSYWSVARLQLQRERLALHCLNLAGFTAYLPRLRVRKMVHGRRITVTPPLFPGYLFIAIQNGRWWDARWSPGIIH